MLKKNGQGRVKTFKHEFAFTGLVRCGCCGSAFTAEVKKGQYKYYHCARSKSECPGRQNFSEDKIIKMLAESLKAVQLNEKITEWLKASLKESMTNIVVEQEKIAAAINADEQRLQNKRKRAYEDRLEGIITVDQYKEINEQVEIQRRDCAARREGNLRLFGYNREWSFYAALHGIFLGCIFTGCLVKLSKKNRLYLWGCYLTLVLFLSVAFGINGVPYIKRVGVIGFALLMPFLIGYYAFHLSAENKRSRHFSLISLFAIVLSMTLAILNEFWPEFPRELFGLPTMVLTHGLLNAIVSIPFFYLAIKMEYP